MLPTCVTCALGKRYGEFHGAPKNAVYCTHYRAPRHYNAVCDMYKKDGTKAYDEAKRTKKVKRGKCARCGFSFFAHGLRAMKTCDEFVEPSSAVQLGLLPDDAGTHYKTGMADEE